MQAGPQGCPSRPPLHPDNPCGGWAAAFPRCYDPKVLRRRCPALCLLLAALPFPLGAWVSGWGGRSEAWEQSQTWLFWGWDLTITGRDCLDLTFEDKPIRELFSFFSCFIVLQLPPKPRTIALQTGRRSICVYCREKELNRRRCLLLSHLIQTAVAPLEKWEISEILGRTLRWQWVLAKV